MSPENELKGSKIEAARFFRVSPPTIGNWIAEGCPVLTGGSNGVPYVLDFAAVQAWKRDRDSRAQTVEAEKQARFASAQIEMFGPAEMPTIPGMEGLSPRGRAELIRARREQIDLLERQGKLVSADEMQLQIAAGFRSTSLRLQTIPDEMQRELGLPPDVVATMRRKIEDVLNELADTIERKTGLDPAPDRSAGHAAAA